MAYILKCNAIFLHVPKTGGSWVTAILKKLDLIDHSIGSKHADMRNVLYYSKFHSGRQFILHFLRKRLLRSNLSNPEEGFFKFCFIRNPLSWYESYWKYNQKLNWPKWGPENDIDIWHPNACLWKLRDSNFNKFVGNVIESYPGYVTTLYSWYTDPVIDFVGRQEFLADDLIFVLNQLQVDFIESDIRQFEKVNTSTDFHDSIQWDPVLRKEVQRLEYAGLVRYGYLKSDEDFHPYH